MQYCVTVNWRMCFQTYSKENSFLKWCKFHICLIKGEVGCYAMIEACVFRLPDRVVQRGNVVRRRLADCLFSARYCMMCDDINFHKLHPNFTFLLTEILYIGLPTNILSLIFLDKFAKFRKAIFSFHRVCPSVSRRGTARQPLEGFSWNFIVEDFSKKKTLDKIQVSLQSDQNTLQVSLFHRAF